MILSLFFLIFSGSSAIHTLHINDKAGLGPQSRSGIYHSVNEVYTDLTIEEGDTLWVLGYYTNPDYNILLEFYGHWDRDEIFDQQSFLILSGVQPPVTSWNGGYIVAKGTVSFTPVAEPLHPVDTVLATIEVFDIDVLMNGEGELINGEDGSPGIDKFNNLKDDPQLPRSECDSCKFAVLISGGVNAHNNHSKYWENLVALFKFKVDSLNYCEHNIFVHYYHGIRRDDRIPANRVSAADSAGIKNSHDEIASRVAGCTQSGKTATFQKMVTNHGKADGTIHLLGNKTLKPSDLKNWQQPIIDSCCTVVKDEFLQCYGGHSVDAMLGMESRNKATIYVNSNSDKETGHSPHGETHHYLQGKIDALGEGKSYEDAVVAGKLAYDAYLQRMIDTAHVRAQAWRNNMHLPNAAQNLAYWVADSTSRAGKICKSRNVTITPMKEYCEWKRYVVPPGGQLVVDFKGDRKGCGNVSVYSECPVTGQKTKVRVWNWNLPGSLRYAAGNSKRVINGDMTQPTAFWIHNDNGEFDISVSANGNQTLAQTPSNVAEYPGFSFGGTDNSAGEFMVFYNQPELFIENIDQIPIPLMQLPACMGPGFVEYFGMSFTIDPTDVLWTNMMMQMVISQVLTPGELHVFSENSSVGFAIAEITEPGPYFFPLADMTMVGPDGQLFLAVPTGPRSDSQALFVIDSWGLHTIFETELYLENITVSDGENACYDALGYITTGGNGATFISQPGSNTELVAGQGVLMLPGTSLLHGSQLRAFIFPGGGYCSQLPTLLSAKDEPNPWPDAPEIFSIKHASLFRVHPNPTTGDFILEVTDAKAAGNMKVGIYNSIGHLIIYREMPFANHSILSLFGQPPGIYFIRVMMGDEVGVGKIVKQ